MVRVVPPPPPPPAAAAAAAAAASRRLKLETSEQHTPVSITLPSRVRPLPVTSVHVKQLRLALRRVRFFCVLFFQTHN